jgi:hypothetical protein
MGVYRQDPGAVILASNYGEAGAVERYAHVTAYSPHMGFWWWGPPPGHPATVVTVGYPEDYLLRFFGRCTLRTRLDNHLDLDNDEQGSHVFICDGMRGSWATLWPRLKDVG